MRERILIISDKQRTLSMRDSLAQQGFFVTVADNVNDGYERALESRFDLVMVNLNGSTDGPGLIKRIRANSKSRRILILAIAEWGSGEPTMALTEGADGFEREPLDGERLVAAVARMMRPNLTMTAGASGADGDGH
jgi:two-component system response regulator CpxR